MGRGEKRRPGKKNATGFDRPKGRHTRQTRVLRCGRVPSCVVSCRVVSVTLVAAAVVVAVVGVIE